MNLEKHNLERNNPFEIYENDFFGCKSFAIYK